MKAIALAVLLAFFSMVVFPGFHFLEGDVVLYSVPILKEINPNLYANDLIAQNPQTGLTFFDEIVSGISSASGLSYLWIYWIAYFVARVLLFVGIYKICLYITKSKKISTISMLGALIPLAVFGTATTTISLAAHPRFIALGFLVFGLSFFLEKKYFQAAILYGVGLLLHPLAAVPFFVHYLFMLEDRGISWAKKISLIVLAGVFAIPFLFVNGNGGLLAFSQMSSEWLSIIAERNSYLFVSQWALFQIGMIFAVGLVLFFCAKEILKKSKEAKPLVWFTAVCLGLFAVSIIFSDFLANAFLFKLQLVRSLVPLKLLLPVFVILFAWAKWKEFNRNEFFVCAGFFAALVVKESFSYFFYPFFIIFAVLELLKMKKFKEYENIWLAIIAVSAIAYSFVVGWIFLAFCTAVIGIIYAIEKKLWKKIPFFDKKIQVAGFCAAAVILIVFGFFSGAFYLEKDFGEMQGAAVWAKENTPKDAVFLAPANIGSLARIALERSVFVGYKDGAQVTYGESFAKEWDKRYLLVEDFSSLDYSKIMAIAKEYKVDFVLTNSSKQFPLA